MLLHNLDGLDLRHHKGRSQRAHGIVQPATNLVLYEEHVGEEGEGREQDRLARATVVSASPNESLDDLLGGLRTRESHAMRIHLVVLGDGADSLLVDLVLAGLVPTVADEDGSRELLVKHDTHLSLEPGDNVKIGDIDDIVAIELLLLVDGRRIGGPLEELDDLLLLKVTGHVTSSSSLIRRNIGNHGLDAGEGGMLGAREDGRNPLSTTRDHLRRVRQGLGIREENVDVLEAVLIGVSQEGLLKGANLLGVVDDGLHVSMGQGLGVPGRGVLLEDVGHVLEAFLDGVGKGVGIEVRVLGLVIALVIALGVLESLTDHEVNNVLLLVGHLIEDVLDGLFGIGVLSHSIS